MEEVRTIDSLEREILEDARKKAERIEKNADKRAEELVVKWDKLIADESTRLDGEYVKRKARQSLEIKAALPLEKKRRKISYVEEIFEKRIAAVTGALSEKEITAILAKRLKKAAPLLRSYVLTVRYSGISRAAAEEVVSSGLGGKDLLLSSSEGFCGLLLQDDKGQILYRLRMEEIIEDLREYHRERVISAVFKGKR